MEEEEILSRLAPVYHDLMKTLLDRPELFARVLTEKVSSLIASHGIVMVLDSEDDWFEQQGLGHVAHVHVGWEQESVGSPTVHLEHVPKGRDMFERLLAGSLEALRTAMLERYPGHGMLHSHWAHFNSTPRLSLCICRVELPENTLGTFTDEELRTLDLITPHLIICARIYAEVTRARRNSFDFFALRCRDIATEFLLTSSEQRLLRLIVEGASNKEIGDELGISLATVKTHISHIMQKTGCRNRIDLIGRHFVSKYITVPR